ncbi:MAG: 30S ribosomal protein S27e [Candidatus Diapherotrites archaeon]|uniref:Small ribosomal subunit protein eS27 n=1 Tax=Candidatus Iainarchaeum sp. TaxID=3101447 RepID=A0A2D6M1A0_9ARCH|nr:30S ribosomal protein S27e [Candidatus Diapherotrites archaeon]|tara:strand:+ start:1972 stop:2166 length:195 start_codon:yes stop_codon:yes gene_type:complete
MENNKLNVPKPKSTFLKVKCAGCGNEQTIFSNANKDVKCLACNNILAESRGGKIKLKAKVVKEL